MTAAEWLLALFWAFSPAYAIVAARCVHTVWSEGKARGIQGFPWYWVIVALAYYAVVSVCCFGRNLLLSPVVKLTVMSLMAAVAWLLAYGCVRKWLKSRRSKSAPPV